MATIFRTLRNNWKKSVFFSFAGAYGANYGIEKLKQHDLMRAYCKEAVAYGEKNQNVVAKAYHVTVILNPAAHGGKARTRFENYCEPLLHLAGLKVSIVRTESNGQAKDIMELLGESDAVLVAGGDGTLMEAVTGMLRRSDTDMFCRNVPLGILPVGYNNFMAKTLFPNIENVQPSSEVVLMAEATMAVIRQQFRPTDVMQVQNLSEEESKFYGRKLYALRQIQIGAFRDSQSRISNYWYFPGIKKYVAHIFAYTTAAKNILWDITGALETKGMEELHTHPYMESQAVVSQKNSQSYWSYIWPWGNDETLHKKVTSQLEQNVVESHAITKWQKPLDCQGVELTIQSDNDICLKKEKEPPSLTVTLGPQTISFKDFVSEAWKRQWNASKHYVSPSSENIEIGWRVYSDLSAVKWNPSFNTVQREQAVEENKLFYLDNEPIDIHGAIEVTMLPSKVRMFCSEALHVPLSNLDNVQSDVNKKWWQRKTNLQSKTSSFVASENMHALKQ